MKKYTYSQARQKLSEVLNTARKEEVIITRQSGESFRLIYNALPQSPLDIPAISTQVTTQNILDAVKESRRKS